jgi:hypothetical protein
VFFQSERTGPPDGGRPLRPPGCTGPTHSRPFVPTKRHCQNATTILRLCSKHKHKLRRLRCVPFLRIRPTFACSLWRILSRTSYRAGPRCAPSIPLVAHGFTTTQPPLARRLARFARMRFAPHFAEPPPHHHGAYSCAPACSATSSDPPESSSPAYSHSRSAVRSVVSSKAFSACFRSTPRPARTLN